MADKKITELQLRSGVTDDLNIPSDDGSQSYRITGAQLKAYVLAAGNVITATILDAAVTLGKLALDVFNGLTAVTAAYNDYLVAVDTSDSNKTKKVLVSDLINTVVKTITYADSPYTVLATDRTLLVDSSGGAITINLTTAVGQANRVLMFKKISIDNNVVTIDGNGTETIDRALICAGYTKDWKARLVSDNANWWSIEGGAQWTFKATSSNAQTGFGADAYTRIEWETEVYDPMGIYNPATGTVTIPAGGEGTWIFFAKAKANDQNLETSGDSWTLSMFKNGSSSELFGYGEIDNPNAAHAMWAHGAVVLQMTTSDYVDVQGTCNDSATTLENSARYNAFWGYKLVNY